MNRVARQVLAAGVIVGIIAAGLWATSYKPSVQPVRPDRGDGGDSTDGGVVNGIANAIA